MKAIQNAYHDQKGADSSTAVGHWCRFTVNGLHVAAIRMLDPNAPIRERLDEEELFMRFTYWLVEEVGVSVETASNYCSTVLAWHTRRVGVSLAGNLPMKRHKALITGLQNIHALDERKERPPRYGVRPQWLKLAIDTVQARVVDEALEKRKLRANFDACAQCAMAGLLRGAEVTAHTFDGRRDVSRADIKMFENGPNGPYAIMYTRNCKAKGAKRFKKIAVYMPSGGRFLDPYAALKELLRIDPVPEADRKTTPLFRNPMSGKALTISQLRAQIQTWMSGLGLNKSNYGAHSLRIGGASAVFAAGCCDPTVIKTLGRWSSDAYLLYVRQNRHKAYEAAQAACDTPLDDLAQEFVAIDDDYIFDDEPSVDDDWL